MTRRVALALAFAAIPAGIAAELTGSVPSPLLDLASGWAMAASAVVLTLADQRRAGIVVGAASLAWFAGTVDTDLVFAHRALLATAVLGAPDARLRSIRAWGAAVVAWVGALPWLPPTPASIATAVAVVVARPRSGVALAFAGAIAWVPLARTLAPAAADTTLAVYNIVIAIPAVLLAAGAAQARSRMADLVVESGGSSGIAAVQRALAEAVGDPDLRIGRWSEDARVYLDDEGRPLDEPGPGSVATSIDRDGVPVAVIVHSQAALADRRLREAVASAARLGAENARLQAELEANTDAVRASRRRLLGAAIRQRALLQQRLDSGPARRLAALEPAVASHPTAASLLGDVRRDLAALGRGLLPGALENGGLRAALDGLAAAAAVPITIDASDIAVDRNIAAAAYFVAAESVANAVKHAGATSVLIVVGEEQEQLTLVVSDDGNGGADPSGTGLQGLADRVQALGGVLTIESEVGVGTRVKAQLPTTA